MRSLVVKGVLLLLGAAVLTATWDLIEDGLERSTHSAVAAASPSQPTRRSSSTRRTRRRRNRGFHAVRRRVLLGRSVLGRPIRAFEIGDPKSPRKVLVVGCIHGNEPAGIAVARALEHRRPPPHVDLWVIDDLNPDGVAANTRQNADGVDLNRNFPFGWRRIGRPGSLYYSGPRPLSEPESRIAWRLIVEIRPRITIWYHQHEGVVDTSGGDKAPEARYAHLVGLPLVRLTRYPGSATTWQDHRFPRAAAFVVELPPGSLDATQADRFAAAVVALGQGS